MMVAIYCFFDALGISFSAALKGAGDTRFVMWCSVIAGWVLFVPPVYLTVSVFRGGLMLAWLWATLYIVVVGLVFFWRFRRGDWKTIDMIGEDRKAVVVPPMSVAMEERFPPE
jgi:MATE family multidrug resistance protein